MTVIRFSASVRRGATGLGTGGHGGPLGTVRRPHRSAALLALLCCVAVSCGPAEEIVLKTADGVELTAADVDRDPIALLPGGAAIVSVFDAPRLFESAAGNRLTTFVTAGTPIPPAAKFDPRRDLDRIYMGFYSLQGADFAGVAQGRFDVEAIEQAADSNQLTALGTPLTRRAYAGRHFFSAGAIGFAVLTTRTVLFGNESGLRRGLDRLEAGRIQDEVPADLATLLRQPGAPFAFGLDPVTTPHMQPFAARFPALDGLQLGRIVGDFQAPGLNLAGTLGYASEANAEQGRQQLLDLHAQLQSFAWLGALFGVGQPLQRLEANTVQKSVQFVAAFDASVANALLDQLGKWTHTQ